LPFEQGKRDHRYPQGAPIAVPPARSEAFEALQPGSTPGTAANAQGLRLRGGLS